VRVAVDTVADTYTISYCLNPLADSPMWVQVGSAAYTDTVRNSTQPLIVGGAGAFALAQILYYCELKNQAGTKIAGVDWRTEWAFGDTTFTDTAGQDWTLSGNASVSRIADEYTLEECGPIFGYQQEHGYYPGVGFQDPSYDEITISAARQSGVDRVTEFRIIDDAPVGEVIYSHEAENGRLIRPYGPVGGGPFRAFISDVQSYGDLYTDYLSNLRGLA
jgi:hypothetical protein